MMRTKANLLIFWKIENFNWSNLLIMPIIVSGGDSDTASQRDLRIFALCSLIDKRDASRTQMNVIGFSILCIIMASWGLKISLGPSCILLIISIIFLIGFLFQRLLFLTCYSLKAFSSLALATIFSPSPEMLSVVVISNRSFGNGDEYVV